MSPARHPGEKVLQGGSGQSLARRSLLAGPPAPARPTPPLTRSDGVRPSESDGDPLAWPWVVGFHPTLVGCQCWVAVAGFATPGWRCWARKTLLLSSLFAAGRIVALLGVAGRCWVLLLDADWRYWAFQGVAVVLRARLCGAPGGLWALLGVVGRF